MDNHNLETRTDGKNRAILVAVLSSEDRPEKSRAFEELQGLAETAGITVVGTLMQTRERPDPKTHLGRGKVQELKDLVEEHKAELVVFDNPLSPAQGRNLEVEIGVVIVDRSEIILDIFATHARTYESKLQVELARLLYMRPRLKRMWTHLERVEGGVGTTSRGPGEKQIESDRRLIDTRIVELKRKLRVVEKRRERIVSQRSDIPTVSLVGYTNAGKSTLMRALTGADVLIADQLFATLDTRTSRWHIPHWGDALLSDTVGFVRDLPHHLVASFKSTLEEARHADLLLHVVDSSSPEAEKQIATVEQVLDEIGVSRDRCVLVLNKADCVSDRSQIDIFRARYPNSISVSAVEKTGVDRLAAEVADQLGGGYMDAEIETDVGNGKLLAYLAEHAQVTKTEYEDSRVRVTCRISKRFADRINGSDTQVRLFAPVFSE